MVEARSTLPARLRKLVLYALSGCTSLVALRLVVLPMILIRHIDASLCNIFTHMAASQNLDYKKQCLWNNRLAICVNDIRRHQFEFQAD
jgi:hypothetical protein